MRTANNNLIGITGFRGSAKDVVAKMIQSNFPEGSETWSNTTWDKIKFPDSQFTVKKFAGKLKQMICVLLGCTLKELESQEFKKKEFFGKTVRELLQTIGTEWGRDLINSEIWVESLFLEWLPRCYTEGRKYCAKLSMSNPDNPCQDESECLPNWIISDVRFPNEVQAIKDRGGIVIRINRFKDNKDLHASEIHIPTLEVDYEIDNFGTISELYEKVQTLYTTKIKQ